MSHLDPTLAAAAERLKRVSAAEPPIKKPVVLKVVVLGSSNVGKTSLMRRFVQNSYEELRRPTIGADYMSKEVRVGDTVCLIQIYDTAGQERFHQGEL